MQDNDEKRRDERELARLRDMIEDRLYTYSAVGLRHLLAVMDDIVKDRDALSKAAIAGERGHE